MKKNPAELDAAADQSASPLSESPRLTAGTSGEDATRRSWSKRLSDRAIRLWDYLALTKRQALSFLLVFAAVLAASWVPLPYVIESPGPTINVLGKLDGREFLSLTGATSKPTAGELRMVTVRAEGGPAATVSLLDLVWAGFSAEADIIPEEEVYPSGVTKEVVDKVSQAQMNSSQEMAAVAALGELGQKVPAKVIIVDVPEGSPAAGKLQINDQIVAVDQPGKPAVQIDTADVLTATMRQVPPGTTLTVSYLRTGATTPAQTKITTMANPEQPQQSGSLLGIRINLDMKLPFQVRIPDEGIGGPSAGLVFSLAMVDRLTGEDFARGTQVAATGTIAFDGKVGQISGVPQKMAGARRDGVEWFLLPADNCADAIGRVPEGLRVIPVEDLKQAHQVVRSISAKEIGKLPSCPAKS